MGDRPGPAATTRWPLLNKQHSAHPRTDQTHLDVAGPAENNQPPSCLALHDPLRGQLLAEQIVHRAEQRDHRAVPGSVSHQPDPPGPAGELAEPAADLDAVPVEQVLA